MRATILMRPAPTAAARAQGLEDHGTLNAKIDRASRRRPLTCREVVELGFGRMR